MLKNIEKLKNMKHIKIYHILIFMASLHNSLFVR